MWCSTLIQVSDLWDIQKPFSAAESRTAPSYSRSDPMCKASINGIWLMDRSRMWVNLCVNYSQFTQSTSAKFKVEFDDLIRGLQLCVCRLTTAMSVDPCRSISCFGSWPRHELLKKIFLDLLAVNTLGYSSSTSLSPSHSFIVCPCEDLDN